MKRIIVLQRLLQPFFSDLNSSKLGCSNKNRMNAIDSWPYSRIHKQLYEVCTVAFQAKDLYVQVISKECEVSCLRVNIETGTHKV